MKTFYEKKDGRYYCTQCGNDYKYKSSCKRHWKKKHPELEIPEDPETSDKHGGKRPNSGRKPVEEKLKERGIKDLLDKHALETKQVTIIDPVTGKQRKVDRPRTLIIMNMLFQKAQRQKDVKAAKEWLNRALGKAPQFIEHSGEIKTEEQRVPTEAELKASRAYVEALKQFDE